MPGPIGIVSLELDLHAHAICHRLRERFATDAHVFAVDDCCSAGSLSVGPDAPATLTDYAGNRILVADLALVWWRRVNQPQKPDPNLDDDTHAFVSAEWRHALNSAWAGDFKGIWVNPPQADVRATAKTVQLRAAKRAGIAVPDTLISNDPERIRTFFELQGGEVVIKKLAGIPGKAFATVKIGREALQDEQMRMCPSVYQQYIEADRHLRVIALGDRILTFAFPSSELDWRRDLNFQPYVADIGPALHKQIIQLLRDLGLVMGVLDLIVSSEGQTYFLEINPQGQFLFLERLANHDVTEFCAEFFRDLCAGNVPLAQTY